jgi:hypothetical protein
MDPLLRHRAARDRAGHTECPDAELLAAGVDGELTARERRAVEAHAADCQRCADTLALSAAAEDPGLSATISHVVAVDRWRRAYWTVPLATAATLAALWVATSREAVAPTPTRITAGTPGAPSPTRTQTIAPEPQSIVPEVRENAASPAREGRIDPAAPRLRDERDATGAPAAGGQAQTFAKASEGVVPQASRQPATRAPAESRASADTVASAPPAVRPTSLAETIGVASIRIASPDMQTIWRTTGTTVERSGDGGMTWTQEFSAPGVLTSGVAVSADTVWLGGVQGLVLRRSASGWTLANPPAAETITAIRATSADAATVTLASGRTLQTTDAGQTWR